METLRRFGITELRPGQTVLVRFGPGPKGLMAAEVRPDGGPHGPVVALILARIRPGALYSAPGEKLVPISRLGAAADPGGRAFVVFSPRLAYLWRRARSGR